MSLRTILSSTAAAAATNPSNAAGPSSASNPAATYTKSNTFGSIPSAPGSLASTSMQAHPMVSASSNRKATRDNRRRATHSQIERRRREKINDRLITLRNLVPACRTLMDEKNKSKGHGDDVDDDGGMMVDGGKRKRKKRKAEPVKKDPNADEELGLHKLDVLTHAIDYIFELHARIEELETGRRPAVKKTADREREEEERLEADGEDDLPLASLDEITFEKGQRLPTSARAAAEVAAGRGPPQHLPSSDDETVSDGLSDMELEPAAKSGVTGPSEVFGAGQNMRAVQEAHHTRTFVHPPRNTIRVPRRGTTTASSSSEELSPPSVFGTSQPSPMILPLNSPLTALTSPLMSLSAGSPIMQATNKEPAVRKHSSSIGSSIQLAGSAAQVPFTNAPFGAGNGRWPVLPPPVVPLNQYTSTEAPPTLSNRSSWQLGGLSDSRTILPGSPRAAGDGTSQGKAEPRSSVKRKNQVGGHDASAAHLLLNFSSSPEALRPVNVGSSATASTSFSRPSQAGDDAPPPYATPQIFLTGRARGNPADQRGYPSSNAGMSTASMYGRQTYPSSAPGGSKAQPDDLVSGLHSPPLFALDGLKQPSISPPQDGLTESSQHQAQ